MAEESGIELPKRKRNKDDGELDVTPMIDVTFLLLAFFVVVSKMDPQAAVPLPMASLGEAIQDRSCVTLILVLDDETGTKPMIYKGSSMAKDTLIADGDEEAQETEIAEFVESEFLSNPSKEVVLIKAGGNVTTGMVELVKRGAAKSDSALANKIYIAIEEDQ